MSVKTFVIQIGVDVCAMMKENQDQAVVNNIYWKK